MYIRHIETQKSYFFQIGHSPVHDVISQYTRLDISTVFSSRVLMDKMDTYSVHV